MTTFFTVSTAGHVDHGKTSLIRALTGIDPDRLKEEKERQMTTDLGFAYMKLGDGSVVGFVDVPGHGKFLKNMLAGVGGIDMSLLVVAADEGPMPQTRQHVRILSLLGVTKAVVALTKIDVVDDQEHRALVKQEIESLLKAHGIEMLGLVPVSSTKGIGLQDLKDMLGRRLNELPARGTAGGAFLPVDRVFSKSGFGTILTGTLVRGQLKTGDQIVIGPDVTTGRIRRLESFGQTVEFANPGQRVACNVVLKDNKTISRGHVVLTETAPATRMLVVSLVDRPRLAGDKFVQHVEGQPVRLYHGTAECHGYVRWAELESEDTDANATTAIALLALEDPAVAQPQDRFVIRLSDETIYGGEVVLRDRARWMKRADLVHLAKLLLKRDYAGALLDFVAAAPHGMAKDTLVSQFLPAPTGKRVVDQLLATGQLSRLGEMLVSKQTRGVLSERIGNAVREAAKQEQNAEGVPLEAVRTTMSPRLDRPTFQSLVEDEIAQGRLVRKADRLTLPGAGVKSVDSATAKLQTQIQQALEQHFCLDLDELARACSADVGKVKTTVQALAKSGDILLVNYEFVISAANLNKAHRTLSDIWNAKRNIAPTDFRESLNTSRKYAMALLQHFDDQKITRRLQNGRVLLKAPN